MHRFFLPSIAIHRNQPIDLSPLARQLHRVLRLTAGAQIIVLDNQGNEFDVYIVEVDAQHALGKVLTQRLNSAEPLIQLTLFQCSLKADKFEWVLQKGTELGVCTFVPVISERSIVRPASALLKKYERWQTILREAAEQCGRGRIPTLLEPMSWSTAIGAASQGIRYLPWESVSMSTPMLSTLVAEQLPSAKPLSSTPAPESPFALDQPIALLIGPEGGITTDEAAQAKAQGWQYASLGPRILRAETAALAATTIIMAATEAR